MKPYRKATFEDIINDATTKEKKAFLKEVAKTKGLKDKHGNPRRITYLEIKRRYYNEFWSELLPTGSGKSKQTIYDIIDEL